MTCHQKIAGHRWNPGRKQWSFPDTPETRAALAEIVAMPPVPPPQMLAVNPKQSITPAARPRRPYVPGRDKPLTTNPPHPLIKRVDDELVLRGMAYGTRKSYGQHLRNYFNWLKNSRIEPEKATREDIRAYVVQMALSGLVSATYCRGARAAIVFLYDVILKQHEKVTDLPQMKRPRQLPIVLSCEEVARLLKVPYNLKHKALLMTAYSAGLRVGEVVRLKVSDIDSKRMTIRVTAGKGAKDRDTLLATTALEILRDAGVSARSNRRIGYFREMIGATIYRSVPRNTFLRTPRTRRAFSSQRRSTPCVIHSPRICWKTVWIRGAGTSRNCWDTEVLRQPSDTRM